RGGLLPAFLCAYLSQLLYLFAVQWLSGDRAFLTRPSGIFVNLFHAATALLPIAIVVVPIILLIVNLFDRRGSFSVVLQQEYASLATVILYVIIGCNIAGIAIGVFLHFSGTQAAYVAHFAQRIPEVLDQWRSLGVSEQNLVQMEAQLKNPALVVGAMFFGMKLTLFAISATLAVREVFRLSALRSAAVVFISGSIVLLTAQVWTLLFTTVVGSPFILLILFFLLRGYFGSVVSTQRARGAFKQNLEAATINPRDSSAHYNLALIHQTRGELDQARERFQRAIDIDPDETDAHYQLGRIARSQNRLAEAIGHFEQVVQRDQYHAQNEIWREIGATYIAAGQFADARDALQKFLERRENDPQGLYLMGRAYAGLGDQQEAASSMQACIDAVKTAPAYKYRAEKRWLHEAQQFLKGKKREAVSSER
ncbi:MAG TPA: tetratricopeptide repeat protein, partial [Pyrinomonadaceae bacterium]